MNAQDPAEKDAGLEGRYHVEKINDPTGKHADCRYFVLDPHHDRLAYDALIAYAEAAHAAGYVTLADDLNRWVNALNSESAWAREDHMKPIRVTCSHRNPRECADYGCDGTRLEHSLTCVTGITELYLPCSCGASDR